MTAGQGLSEPNSEVPKGIAWGTLLQTASILTGVFLLLKAFAVSHFSLTTTGALITTAPLTVFLGSVASYLYLLIFGLVVVCPFWLVRRAAELTAVETGVGSALFGLCLLFFPFPSDLSLSTWVGPVLYSVSVAVAMWVGFSLVRRRIGKGKGPKFLAAHSAAWFVGFGAALTLIPTLEQPWVPAEALVLRGHGAPSDMHLRSGTLQLSKYPVVYVLDESDGWTSALDADTRLLIRIPSSSIAARAVCHHRSQLHGARTLLQFMKREGYKSPNTLCDTLIGDPEHLLLPLVAPTPIGSAQ